MMRFTVLTLFPEMFAPLEESILKRAQQAGLLEVNLVNFRDYATSKHKNVDDVPYGGGAGMVLKPEPLFAAIRDLPPPTDRGFNTVTAGSPENVDTLEGEVFQTQNNTSNRASYAGRRIILLSPQGQLFKQSVAQELSRYEDLVFICGHYEGFDERVRELADIELSIGDYVLTGGELAAMVVMDAVARLIPGVLGESASFEADSHSEGLLEYPQYTRPAEFEGRSVPGVLMSGHHANIERWRRKESLRRTFLRRPDLAGRVHFLPTDYALLEELAAECPEIALWQDRWQHLRPQPKKRRAKAKETGNT